ncbi:C40 family peptidase [Chitinophaga nivalis]|uniref:C40 family peptidase n=1 Tax=Chitinophaga nivalis TaxID=2991709 RepID=A0ABT3IPE9_9BACT|nr:C40 family peptidase [Chitinophaga nivalis]MCW3464705.1 C40 family peptidase [Chitinophaga nivalis]MCW3485604.1 C40 family peptidase [Chitinophaga nivalis]
MMKVKGQLYVNMLVGALSISSCATIKKNTVRKTPQPATAEHHRRVEFLDGIATNRHTRNSASYNNKEVSISKNITRGSANLENAQSWQFKYAQLLDVPVEDVLNHQLYKFIEEWWGTPYRLGGKSRDGIDCSGFVAMLANTVFQLSLTGNSVQLYNQVRRLSTRDLHEGDLVFFKIHHKRISHVGIYLENDKFVHASTSAGVMISDLNEPYWKKYFAGGGRL